MLENEIAQAIVPYCERLTGGHETVNTISNAGFVVVFFYGLWLYRRHHQRTVPTRTDGHGETPANNTSTGTIHKLLEYTLLLLPLLIGIGSALFHAHPTHLTHALDIVPVCLFAMIALWLTLQADGWSHRATALVFVTWIVLTAIAAQWPELLAHSLFYLPTLAVLVVLAIMAVGNQRQMTLLAITFGAALFFRALDLVVCPLENINTTEALGIPGKTFVGTHFLWHLLTALACVICLHLGLRTNPNHKPGQQPG